MKTFFKKNERILLFTALLAAMVLLITCTILLLNRYTDELEKQADIQASLYSTNTSNLLARGVEEYVHKADVAAHLLGNTADRDEMLAVINSFGLAESETFNGIFDVRFFHGDRIYDANGDVIFSDDNAVLSLRDKPSPCVSNVFYNEERGLMLVAFYAPLPEGSTGRNFADSVVLFYPISVLKTFSDKADQTMLEAADFSTLCDAKGTAYDVLFSRDDGVYVMVNIPVIIRDRVNDKHVVDELNRLIQAGESSIIPVRIGATPYVLAVGGVGEFGGGFCVVSLYKAENVYTSGYEFVHTILGLLVVFCVILVVLAVYFVFSRLQLNRKIAEVGAIDPRLGCPTGLKFERDANDILSRNKATQFAVIVAELKHYKYIVDHFGEQETEQVLLYLKMIFSKAVQIDEQYGYLGDGRFVLLYHYREQKRLTERLKTINSVTGRYGKLKAEKELYTLGLDFGIYEVPLGDSGGIHAMITHAEEAKNSVGKVENLQEYKFYNEGIRQSYLQNADIEVRMESALADGEFRVFFQPKLNIIKNRPDGSEALVRWYDAETDTYRPPALFMPLFEANGFVVKLDRYIYTKVCEFIHDCAQNGLPVFPVSVNVSRITAVQPDFLDYYVNTRRKYQIAERFITIEFTESFAYENYDVMSEIINTLHKNGFLCSIDDFGSGYSSYNILKALQMDEIKLDSFFIKRGLSGDRDNKILASVISLGRGLGLKVTQEGVETLDDLNRLRDMGCQVIQGYHYSKPLGVSDYISFLTHAVKEEELERQRRIKSGL